MAQIVTAMEAVKCVMDGATIAVNGVSDVANPNLLCEALRERYIETQSPNGLTVWGATALGISQKGSFADALFMDTQGMVRKVIMGYFGSTPSLANMISENKVACFNLPQGVISHLYRAAAGKKPAIITRVGLMTSIDPRYEGGCVNEGAYKEPQLSSVVTIDGQEYLQYKTPKLDVCFICGTSADEKGNISFENEAAFIDATTMAMATKANGGKVCVQVERITDKHLHSKMVKVPGKLVDYIVVNPNQMQCVFEKSNKAISGVALMPESEIISYIDKVVSFAPGNKRRYDQYIIARRAFKELKSGDIVNLGIGLPGLISTIATESGRVGEFTLTNEVGLLGGVPLPKPAFGASINTDMIMDMPNMFDFYDGGNLDGVYVGAAQISPNGNVGVSKVGKAVFGVGGFVNLTQSSKKIVFMTSFMNGKGINMKFEDNKLHILQDGVEKKFVNHIEQISFSGDIAVKDNQDVTYITERCVFKLTANGLMLTEIAPGIDVEKDILEKMEFVPLIADNLKIMDIDCFDFKIS